MATDTILAPGTPQAKAPLKRSTIIGVGVLIFVLMGLGAMLAQSRKAAVAPQETEERLTAVGNPSSIDQENSRVVVREVPVRPPVRTSDVVAIDNAPKAQEKDPRDQLIAAGTMSRMLLTDESQDKPVEGHVPQVRREDAIETVQQPGSVDLTHAERRDAAIASSPAFAAAIAAAQAANGDRGANSSNVKWLKEFANDKSAASNKPNIVRGQYVLSQGMQIPAILTKNIVSDLPGEITARTIVDVYDSYNGHHLLIPKGALLVGQYNSGVVVGQSRLLFAFKRLVMPNNLSFDLPGANGMDLAGAAGVEGDVNNHFFKIFGTSMLMAVLSWGVERGEPAPSSTNGSSGGPRTAAGQALVDASRTILDRNRNISPTISIPAGTRLNVQVAGDMEFPSAYQGALQ